MAMQTQEDQIGGIEFSAAIDSLFDVIKIDDGNGQAGVVMWITTALAVPCHHENEGGDQVLIAAISGPRPTILIIRLRL